MINSEQQGKKIPDSMDIMLQLNAEERQVLARALMTMVIIL